MDAGSVRVTRLFSARRIGSSSIAKTSCRRQWRGASCGTPWMHNAEQTHGCRCNIDWLADRNPHETAQVRGTCATRSADHLDFVRDHLQL